MYIPEALFTIRDNLDRCWDTSAGDAFALSSIISSFDFIITLVVVRNCLGYTRSATIQLQSARIDILKGLAEISMIRKSVQTARNLIDQYHNCWFKDASNIANKVDAVTKCPRICKRQTPRTNTPSNDVASHFKVNLSIPFLDNLIQEIDKRFSEENCVAMKGLSILADVLKLQYGSSVNRKRPHDKYFSDPYHQPEKKPVTTTKDINPVEQAISSTIKIQRVDKQWKQELLDFCQQCSKDMPELSNLSNEVEKLGVSFDSLPTTVSDTIKQTNPVKFPNILTVLKLLTILPVTSYTCERSASSIRLLKTYLRSSMTQWLDNSIYTQIYKDRS